MADVSTKTLEKYLVELRRIEKHREEGAETKIQFYYSKLEKDLREFLGVQYAKYAEDDMLTFEILQKKGEYAKFLEEVEKHVNTLTPKAAKEIRSLVSDTYKVGYEGMVNAVKKSTTLEELHKNLKGAHVSPEVLKRAVENPISGLTLTDKLEKNRKEVVYNIKQTIGTGLVQGDRMSTMAAKISDQVDKDYRKAMTISRTEVHRVREAGHHDSAQNISETIDKGNSGMVMVKIWRTMQDESVRPQRQPYKRKKGVKPRKSVTAGLRSYLGGPNHVKMEGVTIKVDDKFDLGGGVFTDAPGQSGNAGHDINCRCFLEYDLQKATASDKIKIKKEDEKFVPAKSVQEAEQYAQEVLDIKNSSYKDVDVVTANEWNRGLADTFQHFPELKNNFGFVGECHERNRVLKIAAEQHWLEGLMQKNPGWSQEALQPYVDIKVNQLMKKVSISKYEYAQSWFQPSGFAQQFQGVCVNRDWGKDPNSFIQAIKKDVVSKFHPEGCDTIRFVLHHEIGHQIDAFLHVSENSDIQKLFDSKSEEELTSAISRYAWDNNNTNRYAEMIAEAWGEYCSNPTPRPLAKEVAEIIERLYQEWKKKKS